MTEMLDPTLPTPPLDLKAYIQGFQAGIRPDRLLSLREWADEYRYLSSKSSAEPGKFRSSRTPYIREVMECLSNHSSAEIVVLMFGAQLGKTETLVSWLGYIADASPGPCMIVQPSLDMAKRFSKQRLDPLFEDTPRLKDKLRPARERDSGNSQLAKLFEGGLFLIAGSNSPASLRSAPIRYLALDEVDGYGLTDEGHPIELALARTKTFSRRKVLITSTPTIAGSSNVEEFFLQGDQRFYEVPCPGCGEYQILKWERVKWDEDQPETAHFACEVNGCRIEERHKTQMLENGRWVATAEPKNPKVVSFHLSSLYSPVGWFGLADAVRMFLRTKSAPELLRAFTNTYLAETFQEKGEAPDWERLYRRRESYPIGTVPRPVAFLTAGVDVQKDRLEYEVVGWCRDKSSYSVEYGQLFGDTTSPDGPVWEELDKLLAREFPTEDGELLPIRMMGIDTGYNTQTVYSWVRKQAPNRVSALKGQDGLATMIGQPRPVDITDRGVRIKRGLRLWSVGVSLIKSELYGLLNLDPPLKAGDPHPGGYCHFPEYNEAYFQMLTAEQLIARTVRGYRRLEWQKIRDRNEALDLRVYARASASIVGMDRWRDTQWDALKPMAAAKQPESTPQQEQESRARPATVTATASEQGTAKIKRRRSNYW